MKAQKLTFLALALALAFALNFVEKQFLSFGWLNGGSIMISLVPLLIVSVRYGAKTGVIVGVIYGVMSILFGGYVIHPLQMVFDYLSSFAMVGLVGLFARDWQQLWRFGLGTTIALGAMTASFVLSGTIFFAEYAPVGQAPWLYALIYNGTYMLPTLILAIVITPTIGRRIAQNEQVQQ